MSDFNANKKEQTYGNRHSILKGISRMYYELYGIFGVEKVGSGKFTHVEIKRNCCRVKGFDENTRYFTVDLQNGCALQKAYVKISQGLDKELIKDEIEQIANKN